MNRVISGDAKRVWSFGKSSDRRHGTMKHESAAFGCVAYHIAGYAGQKDGAAIITRLMDTIQKTAAVIIEKIEIRLLGARGDNEETEEAPRIPATFSNDRALVGA